MTKIRLIDDIVGPGLLEELKFIPHKELPLGNGKYDRTVQVWDERNQGLKHHALVHVLINDNEVKIEANDETKEGLLKKMLSELRKYK